ncbi:MAG: sulfite exporter TauE/SafE family protein [Pseudomonadales bacterium]|nr:sulfite exporter TauE/SafE family protein [Pseudomonadales bacterium]
MDIGFHFFLLIVAILANLLSALAGGGAGLIQLPVLIFLGLPFPVALATHKVASVALGVGATSRHWRSRKLQWQFALFILCCGLPGVIVGANTILLIPENLAKISLGMLTISLGLYSFLKKELGQTVDARHRDIRGFCTGGLVLFAIGFLNGSLTSGTGLFVTLWLIRWFGLDYKMAVAYTLILVGLFWNGTGALTLGLQGQIQWDWLPALLAGSFIGGYLGTHIGLTKGNTLIKRAFEITAILIGASLIIKSL